MLDFSLPFFDIFLFKTKTKALFRRKVRFIHEKTSKIHSFRSFFRQKTAHCFIQAKIQTDIAIFINSTAES